MHSTTLKPLIFSEMILVRCLLLAERNTRAVSERRFLLNVYVGHILEPMGYVKVGEMEVHFSGAEGP